jgi:hypothetical protein
MMPHREYQRPREVYTHFPIHTFLTTVGWNIDKPGMRGFPKLAEERKLYGHTYDGLWIDIGKPEDYLQITELY